jgi:hypothetical protein
MKTSPSQTLIELFKFNNEIIHAQVKGITQAESLLQPPFQGNCLNWVIGHIVGIRSQCLKQMGLPGVQSEAENKIYGYGSDPLTDPAKACDLIAMLQKLDESLKTIVDKLGSLSETDMEQEVQIWRGKVALSEALAFMHWHESYHSGQLELLRQLAGKNDKTI